MDNDKDMKRNLINATINNQNKRIGDKKKGIYRYLIIVFAVWFIILLLEKLI